MVIQQFSQDQPAFSDVSPLLSDEQVAKYKEFYAEQKRKCLVIWEDSAVLGILHETG